MENFRFFRNFSLIVKFNVCGEFMKNLKFRKNLKFFPLLSEGEMKICIILTPYYLQTKRNLKRCNLGHILNFLP